MELFGLRLKALREGKNLTQEQLAEKVGVKTATISGYERSCFYPKAEVLVKLCCYLEVSADFLLGLPDELESLMTLLTDEQHVIVTNTVNAFVKANGLSKLE